MLLDNTTDLIDPEVFPLGPMYVIYKSLQNVPEHVVVVNSVVAGDIYPATLSFDDGETW